MNRFGASTNVSCWSIRVPCFPPHFLRDLVCIRPIYTLSFFHLFISAASYTRDLYRASTPPPHEHFHDWPRRIDLLHPFISFPVLVSSILISSHPISSHLIGIYSSLIPQTYSSISSRLTIPSFPLPISLLFNSVSIPPLLTVLL